MHPTERRSRTSALKVVVGVAAVAGAVAAISRALRMISIGAAYKAKILCSGLFVAHREADAILDCDLTADNLKILRCIDAKIDRQSQLVTASFLGLVERKALFRPGLGSTLLYHSAPSPTALTPSTALPYEDRSDPPTEPTALTEAFDARLDAPLDWAFSEPDPAHLRRTRAVVVLRGGRIIAERYAPGFGKDTPLLGWSMTKAVMNALVGIMVKEGRLSLDGPLPVPEWQGRNDRRRKITLDHLLQMSSGLRFREDYGNPLQDVTIMLLAVPDAAAYAARKPLDAEPGTRWSYSSGTTNIISRLIRHTLGERAYLEFPRRALFERTGMKSAVVETDASGTFVGSSFMYATARDWARFGQLYLQDGWWGTERILPEGWVKFSTTPAPLAPSGEYGAHIWLKIPLDFSSKEQEIIPADAFHAVGHEGQLISVIPSRDLVIVRLGLTRFPSAWLHDRFIRLILRALED